MYRVQVLMSTYNGERYLKEQIDSIIKQKDVEASLLIRDDGSKDNTAKILEEYGKFSNISVIYGANLGATRSFFELIRLSGNFDFYSFADQDDVWDEDKLICAVNMLKEHADIPCVYSSNTRLVDDKLKPLKSVLYEPKISLGSVIVKNISAGCTMVMNNVLMKQLKAYIPSNVPYHDWWVNVVTLSLGGKIVFDEKPHISYRQHGNNVVGAQEDILKKWQGRLNKYLNSSYRRDDFVKEVIKGYGKVISEDNLHILELMANYRSKPVALLKSKYFHTAGLLENIAFGICVLTKRA